MRISRQRLCFIGLLSATLSCPASGEPQLLPVPQEGDPADYPAGRAENRNDTRIPDAHDLGRPHGESDNEIPGDSDFRLFFVPAGDDPLDYPAGPTVVNASAIAFYGSTLRFDVFIQAPVPFRFIDARLPCVAAGGAGGSIAYWGGSLRINSFRRDFLLFQSLCHGCAQDQTGCPDGAFRFACGSCPGTPLNAPEPRYFADFELFIPPDAAGTFTLTFVEPATGIYDIDGELIPGLVTEQLVLETGCALTPCLDVGDCACPFAVQCTLTICDNGWCTPVPITYGDVNLDGVVDLFDITCVLDGFMGSFKNCAFVDSDIADCRADGVIDLFDLLAVLDAFAGVAPCSPWCGPFGGP